MVIQGNRNIMQDNFMTREEEENYLTKSGKVEKTDIPESNKKLEKIILSNFEFVKEKNEYQVSYGISSDNRGWVSINYICNKGNNLHIAFECIGDNKYIFGERGILGAFYTAKQCWDLIDRIIDILEGNRL